MEGDAVPLLISRSSDQWVSKGVKTLLLRTEKVAIKPADTDHNSFPGSDNRLQNSWRATNRQYWLYQDKESKKWSLIPKNGNCAWARSDCLCLQGKRKPWVITLTCRLPAANQALNSHLCSLHILQMKCCWHSCFTTCQNGWFSYSFPFRGASPSLPWVVSMLYTESKVWHLLSSGCCVQGALGDLPLAKTLFFWFFFFWLRYFPCRSWRWVEF